jgi:hypothetical protein
LSRFVRAFSIGRHGRIEIVKHRFEPSLQGQRTEANLSSANVFHPVKPGCPRWRSAAASTPSGCHRNCHLWQEWLSSRVQFWEDPMRATLAIVLGALLIIGFAASAGPAASKSQAACNKGCATYTGGKRNKIFQACMVKCLNK